MHGTRQKGSAESDLGEDGELGGQGRKEGLE